jgi:hypothetical protein
MLTSVHGFRKTIRSQKKPQGDLEMQTRISGAREDAITGAIESKTAQIPSSGYLAAALASMATSAVLKALGKNDAALFVGQWAPALLIMGLYNKMVKQHGTDAASRPENQWSSGAESELSSARAATVSA